MNKLIYLAGPYSYNPEGAFELHMKYAAHFLAQDIIIFSPIVHNHPLATTHFLPKDYLFWTNYNRALLLKCDELWVTTEPGWEESKGTLHEISIAESHKIPIKYIKI